MSLEWLIDLIKEWVLSLGYATIVYVDAEIAAVKAWVEAKLYLQKAEYPGYGMPIHVTGETDPDVTCTYFRAGDYLGKPYYSQEDGSYFIWWNGTKWIIGTEVGGGPGTRKFDRADPSVFGDYTLTPGNTGTPNAASGYKYLLTSFVDRGDIGANDFGKLDLTLDGAWHDLDLSGIVPADAKGVGLYVAVFAVGVGQSILFRTKGNVNIANISRIFNQVSLIWTTGDFFVPLDADRKIEYMTISPVWVAIVITVKNWWL